MSLLSPSLEAFMAVVEETTVMGAARSLGLTQTGVTQRIRTLEKQLGVTLFLRSRRGMSPTPEGEALRRYCITARELEGQTMAELKGQDLIASVEMSIAGPSSALRSRVIPRCLPILKKHPQLKLKFDLTDSGDILTKLKKGEAELGLLAPELVVNEMDSRKLKPERYILVGPYAWKKRPLEEILVDESIVDFNEDDKMTFNFLEKYRWLAKCRKERHFANNTDALTSFIQEGFAYSVLTEEFAAPFIKNHEMIDLAPGKVFEQPVALAWYPRPQMPPYFKTLIDSIAGI